MALVWLPNMAFNHKLSPGSPKGIYKQNINKRQKKKKKAKELFVPSGFFAPVHSLHWLCGVTLFSPA